MSEPDVYTIAVDEVPESPEEIFGPRPAVRPGELVTPGVGNDASARIVSRSHTAGSPPAERVGLTTRRPGRVPAASTMSLLLCGAGQVFNGQFKLGVLLLLVEAFFVIGHRALIGSWSSMLALGELVGAGEAGLLVGVAVFDFLMVLFIPAVVYQAYQRAESEHGSYEGMRNSVLPGLASLLLPGWGQLLNAQIGKAVFFLFCMLSALWVAAFFVYAPILSALSHSMGEAAMQRAVSGGVGILIAAVLMWVLSIYDAVLVSSIRRHG